MLKLFTDTDTDITPAVAAEYGYSLISMPYSVDAKTVYPYVDFDEFEPRPFYDMLRSGVLPTTSAISKERYIEYFEPAFAAGNDILYVHFSRAMTVTFNAMDEAVAELKAKSATSSRPARAWRKCWNGPRPRWTSSRCTSSPTTSSSSAAAAA